eukprot:3251680-Amphidinium_carterae.1
MSLLYTDGQSSIPYITCDLLNGSGDDVTSKRALRIRGHRKCANQNTHSMGKRACTKPNAQ